MGIETTDKRQAGAYTIEEVAQRVNVSPKVVRRWTKQGRIAGTFRAGRQWRFDRLAVEKSILSGEFLRPAQY
ncbi:MAG: helix-turn-helix domain-containing protein [Chitinivibrionales bacterium]|nr:helix-turn-helix domain-containing protein [Chitinivibrionales bacterium]